jgi:predicted transcriptional regulator
LVQRIYGIRKKIRKDKYFVGENNTVWSGKRGALEILVSIVSLLAENKLKKTNLTYKANLDSRLASKYINSLVKFELVAKSSMDPSFYVITQKGRDFLKQYSGLIKMIEFHA